MTSQTIHNDLAGHPVGWWPLSDGANATANYSPTFAADNSGSGNTAYLSGSGPGWNSGAATFNAKSGLLATVGPVLDTTKSYSVSAWVNLADASTGYGYDAVSQGGTNIGSFALQYSGGYGGWSFTSASADSTSPSFYSAHLSTKPALNVWTHLVGTFDASTGTMSLYVNGALAATGHNPSPWTGGGPLAIGGDQQAGGAQGAFFDGQIANVQVYQRALSGADVTALYKAGQSGAALDANPVTTAWALDQRGLPTSMTDADGNTTAYLYDEAGKLAEVTGPSVSTEVNGGAPVMVHPITTYGYDTFGERVSAEDPNGNITTTNYDADGRPVAQILPPYTPPGSSTPITATTTRTYDAIGEVTSATDPLGNTTSYTYDQLGDVATVTQPGGGVTHYTYDTNGERLLVTNPVGAQTQATYDYLGRQLTSTQIVRQPSLTADTTTSAYADQAGYLSSVTSAAGVTSNSTYDAVGEVTSVTDGAGNTTSYTYDGLGRRTVTTLPDGTSQHVTYDGAGNAVAMTSEDASQKVLRQSSASYDANGNVTAATDAMGNSTTLSYNALGLPVQEVQPVSSTSSITTSFGYDAAGNRTRYTDGNGNSTVYTYNSWNLPESTILPATTAYPDLASRTFTTSYDAAGHPVQQTSPGGVTVTATYDALGDLTSQSGTGAEAPTTTRSFSYNSAGELTSASAPGGTDNFTYDDRGLLLSATGPSGSSSFAYNPDGHMASQTTAAGTSSYGYDNAGRLATLTDASTGAMLTYGYNSDSLPTSIGYGSGAATRTFSYNALHELTGDTLTNPAGQTEASISYGYNANGDEVSKDTTGFLGAAANSYTYDQANRLTSWTNGSMQVTYGYDAAGNRTQVSGQTFTYDARDELLSGSGNTYTYSARGTLASVTGASGTTNAAFDAFGQLITEGTQTYSYDALGRVVTAQGGTFSYSGMGNQAASDGGFTYSRDPGGGLIGVASGSSAVLAMTDRHLDVVGEFTATGSTLTGSTTYGPLGTMQASTGMAGNLGYQSGWTDPSTGKVNMTSRWYDPASGQFLSRDAAAISPLPASVAANAFAYGDDNPLTAYDPLGTCNWWDVVCGAQQVVHAVTNTVTQAWNDVTTTVGNIASNIGAGFQYYMSQIPAVFNWVATQVTHIATAVVNTVQDAYHTAVNVVHNVYNGAVNVVHSAYTKVTTAVAATYHAVKYAASTAVQFVQHHAAAIVSFVASTAVFLGCDAAADALAPVTAGVSVAVGAVGCSALAGAVGNVVTYAMSTPVSKWTIGGFAGTALSGAVVGAAAGAIMGPLGSKLLGPVMDAIGSRLGPAVVDDAASAVEDTADSALDGAASDTGAAADSSASDATASADSSASSSASADTSAAPESEPTASSGDAATNCPNSFTGKTRVLLANGVRVAIDKLTAGQRVRATDPYTRVTAARQIVRVIRHTGLHTMVAITLLGGAVLHATDHHPFWDATTHRFTYADALEAGDKLAEPNGRLIAISKTRTYEANLTAYNLSISGIHTYYVLAGHVPVLVHNSCTPTNVTVRWRPGMPKSQFGIKARQLQDLSDQGMLFKAPNPVARDTSLGGLYKYGLIRRVFNQFGASNPELAQTLRTRILNQMNADHVWDLQLGGLDDPSNLHILDAFTNQNMGSQIWSQIMHLPDYTPISITIIGPP
jgi:RHS repeat-associated protein